MQNMNFARFTSRAEFKVIESLINETWAVYLEKWVNEFLKKQASLQYISPWNEQYLVETKKTIYSINVTSQLFYLYFTPYPSVTLLSLLA